MRIFDDFIRDCSVSAFFEHFCVFCSFWVLVCDFSIFAYLGQMRVLGVHLAPFRPWSHPRCSHPRCSSSLILGVHPRLRSVPLFCINYIYIYISISGSSLMDKTIYVYIYTRIYLCRDLSLHMYLYLCLNCFISSSFHIYLHRAICIYLHLQLQNSHYNSAR